MRVRTSNAPLQRPNRAGVVGRCLLLACVSVALSLQTGCGASDKPELWIYTSIYREVLDDMEPQLQRAMPEMNLRWYKAGSEEVAARITAELASGSTPCDVLISGDDFWYQALKEEGRLRPYVPPGALRVPQALRDPDGAYVVNRSAVMVIGYNRNVVPKAEAPRSFAELSEPRWKGKVVLGDPLKSGTSLATVAMLVRKYGWDYYRRLRSNGAVVEGGNSAVMRRIETGDRPVGIILQENLLKGLATHSPAEIVYPSDGAIVIPTAMAIMASTRQPAAAEKLMRYLTEREGLEAIVRGWMYACDPALPPPRGGLPFAELLKTGMVLDYKVVKEVTPQREQLKETFSQVMFE